MRNVLGQIHRDVTGGKSISDAMQAQAAMFGDAYVASVAAGEAAGKLPEVLSRLAQFQRTEIRVRATIRTLLAYPILLSGVSSLVVMGLVTFVLPKFVDIFGAVRSAAAGDHAGRGGGVRRDAAARTAFGCRLSWRRSSG